MIIGLRAFMGVIGTGLLMLSTSPVSAQATNWPSKPVRIVNPAPGGSDILWRLMQPKLQEIWGQPVVIENKPGASGNIAVQEVLRSDDNETLFGGPDSVATSNAHFFRRLPFNPEKDLVAASYVSRYNQVLVCGSRTGFSKISDFVDSARKGPVTVAVSGSYGAPALATALLSNGAKLNLLSVIYKGPSQSILDIAAGEVQCGVMSSRIVLPFLKDQRVKALAIASNVRSPLFPGVPTIGESVLAGYDASSYEVILVPARMPKEVVAKINRDVAKVLESPEIRRKMAELDFTPVGNTLAEAAKKKNEDFQKWAKVSKTMGVVAD